MIDLSAPVNLVLMGLAGLIMLIATFYVNRFLRRKAAKDILEEAIIASVAVTQDPVLAALHVRVIVPEALKVLGTSSQELREKVEKRVSSSRSQII